MRTIHDYLEGARNNSRFNSDADLARAMMISVSSVSNFRRGIAYPDDQNMVKLAALAGISPEQALLELSYWRADGEAKATYERLIKRLGVTAAAIAAMLFINVPNAIAAPIHQNCSHQVQDIVYYGKYRKFITHIKKFFLYLSRAFIPHFLPVTC